MFDKDKSFLHNLHVAFTSLLGLDNQRENQE